MVPIFKDDFCLIIFHLKIALPNPNSKGLLFRNSDEQMADAARKKSEGDENYLKTLVKKATNLGYKPWFYIISKNEIRALGTKKINRARMTFEGILDLKTEPQIRSVLSKYLENKASAIPFEYWKELLDLYQA